MSRGVRFVSIVATLVCAACAAAPAAPIGVSLVAGAGASPAHVLVTGLMPQERQALAAAHLTDAEWESLLRVTIAGGAADEPPVPGSYAVEADGIRFTPRLPFEAVARIV